MKLERVLLYLFHTHLLQLLLPVFRVAVVIVRRWRELAEDAGVAVVAQICQVGDVELELAAVLGQGQQRGHHLQGGGTKGKTMKRRFGCTR